MRTEGRYFVSQTRTVTIKQQDPPAVDARRECLKIIESKSKVCTSRNKADVAKVSSNSSTSGISPDVAALTTEVSELKNMMKTMLIDKQKAQAPVPVKAVEQSCVTCGGAHSYRNCPPRIATFIETTFRVRFTAAAS
ncbi:hypothetical protein Tco_0145858 [Tanacetum coccineum]